MTKKLKDFSEAEKYLYSTIPSSYTKKFPGSVGLNRTKKLLENLGSPQEKVSVIHIAGTSGKGSTATMISKLLENAGFKVGLTLSPHLVDIRERIQINNKLITKKKFTSYLNEILPNLKKINKQEKGEITYFEVLQVLAYYVFSKEKVDYAIIETGMGGTYDATNTVENKNKICVITRIGLDHTNILGTNEKDIANQKAGIIQNGNIALVLKQSEKINEVFRKRAQKVDANLDFVEMDKNLETSLEGEYQKENASLAVEALKQLSIRDGFKITNNQINKTLQNISFKGRFDITKYKGKTLIIDGAHNEQKMNAFLSSLKNKYPNEKFNFLIAFKKGKEHESMLKEISKLSSEIVITEFFTRKKDTPKIVEKIENISKLIKTNKKKMIKDTKKALNYLSTKNKKIVITGSLYLIGEIYNCLD